MHVLAFVADSLSIPDIAMNAERRLGQVHTHLAASLASCLAIERNPLMSKLLALLSQDWRNEK